LRNPKIRAHSLDIDERHNSLKRNTPCLHSETAGRSHQMRDARLCFAAVTTKSAIAEIGFELSDVILAGSELRRLALVSDIKPIANGRSKH
jgi:hypothetical protein